MALPRTLDLHMHSTVSDGTDTPAALLALVKEAGLELFSVTDHDAVKGSVRLRDLRGPNDPALILGAEFSCRDGLGKYHILGYGYDPDAPAIRGLTARCHGLRMDKVRMRIEFLAERFGFRFSQAELDALFALDNPGKPHIGNLMVKHGYAPTKEKAIRDYINQLRIPDAYIGPEEAIAGILAAGGVPILAHPVYGDGDQLIMDEELEGRVRRLMGFGLMGLEGYYSGYSEKLRRDVLALAARFDLYVTAGSDYHGTNKLIPLGDTGLGDPSAWPDGLLRFLRDVALAI